MTMFRRDDMTIMQTEIEGVTRYAFGDTRIYRVGVESFPNHVTNMYLILDGEASLVDVGFNAEKARADLERGFQIVNREFEEKVGFGDIASIIITHGHGDHFGMLEDDRLKGRKVYIHRLDSGIIKDYTREYVDWKEHAVQLVREAGCNVEPEAIFSVDQLGFHSTDYEIIEVIDGERIVNGYEVCHAPGHSPGEICLKVGPVLFLGDHMLSITTPHQTPKSSWQGAGLRTYLGSLKKVAGLEVKVGLAAHEDTIYSVKGRAEEIETFHHQRLGELMELCLDEKNLYQLTTEYYRHHPDLIQASSIEELAVDEKILALEEIKAHVEYLLEEERMTVASIEDGIVKYRSR
ncbi:MAG: MBL fold metallo-hydrolase [Chloroflexi bacterium]|nr:MBL fold metallo-hydrolase [Chloroflexota bacterium]